MLLWINDETHAYQYPLDGNNEEITMEDFHITLMKVRRGYLLHVPSSFQHSRIYLQVNQRLEVQCEEHLYQFFLFDCGNEFSLYKRYAFQQTLTVGRDSQNTISIQNPFLSKYQFSCDPKTKQIQIFASLPRVALNGNIILDKAEFHDGDVLTFLCYRFVFLPDGVMLNQNETTQVSLHPFIHDSSDTALQIPSEKIPFFDMHPSLNSTFVTKLKDYPSSANQSDTRPLFLMIGPSLLMSSASLTTGLISAYQAYMSGRDMTTFLPMLILPGTMFFSTLLFHPLAHWFEKRKEKQKKQESMKKYENHLKDVQAEIQKFKVEYQEMSASLYPSISILVDQIYHVTTQNQRENKIELRFGMKKDVLSFQIENKNAEEQQVQKMIDSYIQESKVNENADWIIDLNDYAHIAFSYCAEQISYFQQILLQIIYYYDLPVMIYSVQLMIEKCVWLRQIPNVYFCDVRMITQNWDDIMQWKERLKDKKCILISFYRTIPASYQGIWLQLLEEDTFVSSDLLIHAGNRKIFDYLKNQEMLFEWENQQCLNYPQLLYFLRKKKARLIKNKNDFFSIHHIENLKDVDIQQNWNMHSVNDSLEAFIGMNEQGKRITLDLNEKKDGPHGLIAGMTGSGKSELIISLLLSLAYRYSYQDVQFALIDFKGGGGSEVLNALPHVASKLTNLDTSNMRRALISFHNECVYREICIHKMNMMVEEPIMNLSSYRKYWKKEYDLPHLSDLMIVIDEFAELKRQQPEFMNDLISLSRIGRSLGIHLILCTQKPTGVINEEIWSNCSFKICLKVQDKQDSMQMIHTDEAMYLKQPGSFYMLSDHGLQKGIAAYANETRNYSDTEVEVLDAAADVLLSSRDYLAKEEAEVNQIISRIRQSTQNISVRPLWLEPLGEMNCKMMQKDIFAFVDDFYERRYLNLHLYSAKKRNSLFVSCDYDEKISCLYAILYACMNDSRDDDEIYIVDSMHQQFDEIIASFRNLISVITEDDQESWDNLVKHLTKRSRNRKLLIIRDISRFYESELSSLHDILEHANEYNLYNVIFASNASAIKYKDLSFIQRRFTLMDENLQDVQQVLETNEKVIQDKMDFGLLKKDHVLEFRFFKVAYQQLMEKAEEHALKKGKDKAYQIPCMCRQVSRNLYRGEEIPVGILYDSYEWLTFDPRHRMYIVSLYKEEWIQYYHAMKMYCKCATLDEDYEDAQFIFLSLEEYRLKFREEYPVLYIGESFSKQYTFFSRIKSLKEGDAIYFENYDSRKVKVL